MLCAISVEGRRSARESDSVALVPHPHRIKGQYALCTMCIGVGRGIAIIQERV
jgi:acetyl-CoA acetyltransferase